MPKTITSKQYKNLISWLKEARTSQGLSMRSLGQKLNQPHSYVQKIESIERKLDVLEYVQYCKALNISPKDGLDILT